MNNELAPIPDSALTTTLKDCYLHIDEHGLNIWAFDMEARRVVARVSLNCTYSWRPYSQFYELRQKLHKRGYNSSQFQQDEKGSLWVSFNLSIPPRFWENWTCSNGFRPRDLHDLWEDPDLWKPSKSL